MGPRTTASAVIAGWLVALAVLLPLAGKLGDVKTDRLIDYLPASAQSTEAAQLEQKLPGGNSNLFVVAYSRATGLTEQDRSTAAQQFSMLSARYAPDAPMDAQPMAARDGTALLYQLVVDESHGKATEYIKDLRAALTDRPDGLRVQVTGPAALQADFEGTFDGVDGRLLLVTVLVVAVLLLLIYRSPLLWLVPLISVAVANVASMALVYGLVRWFDIVVSDQSAAVLTILVFGVGTDYALLLVARYREELHRYPSPSAAMIAALRRAAPAIIASAATVTAGLLCLLVADMNSTAGMGPVGAAGIVCTLVVMLTFFPAFLVLCGRWVFWPRIPHADNVVAEQRVGLWDRVGTVIARRPVLAAAATTAVLALLTLGLLADTDNLAQVDRFVSKPESVAGQELVAERFPERGGLPLTVMARTETRDAALRAIQADPGIGYAEAGRTGQGYAEIIAIPRDRPDSAAEYATIDRLREILPKVAPGALVGGASASNLDTDTASGHDNKLVLPLVLLIVTLILGLLLRSVVAPIGLVLTVVLSFGSALGASVFLYQYAFGFQGLEPSLIVMTFLFLVALGVDYNIFLMSRAREESLHSGTRTGILRSLAVTGGVITSAGVVLAATFAVLTTLPLVAMVQVGFTVAFGVLLDTLLVRSVLVPALTLIAGDRTWWPSKVPAAAHDDRPQVEREPEPARI
ncbi:MMPL family transporter [Nocardia sp. NPDC052566]|uniref:MMPL family transporter n=1 Tax=Nocardia sp. NPDC052566 TaxID=3364330 RepID=UPI0037CB216B